MWSPGMCPDHQDLLLIKEVKSDLTQRTCAFPFLPCLQIFVVAFIFLILLRVTAGMLSGYRQH